MGIQSGDIKLVTSQVMDDVDEGGGSPTSIVIQDGTSNSIFNDISELDRAGGRVNLRKVFVNVQTPDTDTYLGANVIVADPPDDPRVSVTIFKTGATFDRRNDATNRIEAYMNKASGWDGYLFENHIAGQRSIQIFHRVGTKPPVVGKTLYLVANEGLSSEYFQYIRVTDVSSESRTFSYMNSGNVVDYHAQISTCTLSDALNADFPGSPPSPLYAQGVGKATLRDTVVADAAQYYGASPVAEAVTLGAVKATVDSIFTKIVPSAQTETALVDMPMTGVVGPLLTAATAVAVRPIPAGSTVAPNGKWYLPTACVPGSFKLNSPLLVTDDSKGNVVLNAVPVGSIDYAQGVISWNTSAPSITLSSGTEEYIPGASVSQQGYTEFRTVTTENRSYVWVIPLTPIPAPGATAISYMVQGNWYELTDDGTGVLRGADAAFGVGTVSFTTGTLSVTLGALPDVGSELLIAWGTSKEAVPLSDANLQVAPPVIEFDLGQAALPGTVVFTWSQGKTATDDGKGNITGDATGTIYYGTGKGELRMASLISAANIGIDFKSAGNELYAGAANNANLFTATLPNGPIKPGSLTIEALLFRVSAVPNDWGQVASSAETVASLIRDDGAGGLVLEGVGALSGSSINYTTGALTITMLCSSSIPRPVYERQA